MTKLAVLTSCHQKKEKSHPSAVLHKKCDQWNSAQSLYKLAQEWNISWVEFAAASTNAGSQVRLRLLQEQQIKSLWHTGCGTLYLLNVPENQDIYQRLYLETLVSLGTLIFDIRRYPHDRTQALYWTYEMLRSHWYDYYYYAEELAHSFNEGFYGDIALRWDNNDLQLLSRLLQEGRHIIILDRAVHSPSHFATLTTILRSIMNIDILSIAT